MEKVLEYAINKAKMYGIPIIVYIDNETKEAGCSSVDTFSIICCDAVYVVLSDGSYEKIGTANVTAVSDNVTEKK